LTKEADILEDETDATDGKAFGGGNKRQSGQNPYQFLRSPHDKIEKIGVFFRFFAGMKKLKPDLTPLPFIAPTKHTSIHPSSHPFFHPNVRPCPFSRWFQPSA
jgi:hypothetical protein